ncbi:MAG: hypothetical protein QOE18_1636 [Chloroflexota bacterium]|nr:hypothetical protein [Chloroflexota bacterium]
MTLAFDDRYAETQLNGMCAIPPRNVTNRSTQL